jgi:hypothetical protein
MANANARLICSLLLSGLALTGAGVAIQDTSEIKYRRPNGER